MTSTAKASPSSERGLLEEGEIAWRASADDGRASLPALEPGIYELLLFGDEACETVTEHVEKVFVERGRTTVVDLGD